ncbi:recombinase family protein [Eubacteriales bacterium OttesenSCG-928-G02]|nr:recombinase family protein [Eubacteriales bacterium OttesenSCG-928-G02]
MLEYVIAKYKRLSMDDKVSESMSLFNQNLILDRHIAELSEFTNAKVLEFEDNGYSGTNFERPAVQELLELVRQGKIHCVIVKDFSRFGRNAIEMGYFIEQVFPLYQTRFISVSDNFDSEDYKGSTGGIDVAFKFLMHETYSRDLSKKIMSAKQTKMRRGEYVHKNCLYGYRVDEQRKMVIDEPAAANVRMVYEMILAGKNTGDICRTLFERKIPTPSEYKSFRGEDEPSCLWTTNTLIKILIDERYTGTYIAGKTKTADVGNGRQIKVDESEWIKIPGKHLAVIDKIMFDEVQEKMKAFRRRDSYKPRQERIYPLKGKVYCGCCNHAMQRDPVKDPIYRCRRTKANPKADCFNMTMRESDIDKLLITIIRKQLKVLLNVDEVCELTAADVRTAEAQERQTQISRLEDEKQRLYERFVSQKSGKDEYRTQKAALDEQVNRLRQQHISAQEQSERNKAAVKRFDKLKTVSEETRYKHGLTQSIADMLIEKVFVFPNGSIEILWKFEDFTIEKGKDAEDENSGYLQ